MSLKQLLRQIKISTSSMRDSMRRREAKINKVLDAIEMEGFIYYCHKYHVYVPIKPESRRRH